MFAVLLGILSFVALALSLYHFEKLINPGSGVNYKRVDVLEKFIFDLDPEWDRIANFMFAVTVLVLMGVADHFSRPLAFLIMGGLLDYDLLRFKVHGL